MSARRLYVAILLAGWITWLPPAMAQRAAVPPDADDVMNPLQHQIRITPGLLDAMGRYTVTYDLGRSVLLDPEQKRRLIEIARRRVRAMSVERHAEGSTAAEALVASLSCQYLLHVKVDPASAREFAGRLRPVIKISMDFWAGFIEDARPVLNAEQQRQLVDHVESLRPLASRIDHRLERWSRGEMGSETGLMHDIWSEEPADPSLAAKRTDRQQAEENARAVLQWTGPREWRQFLMQAARAFKFDDAQMKASERLLRDYSDKAKAIMTDEWKARLMANRIKAPLEWLYRAEPLAPWVFHLHEEFSTLTEPIEELGRCFRRDVTALATPEQRTSFMIELRQIAEAHGMTPDEVEAMRALLPQTQPATAPDGATDRR